MKYNSTRDRVRFPEYGRYVQLIIQHAKTVEDPREKQAVAEKAIDLMNFVSNQDRNNAEVQEKLWHHMFIIANYDLDVVSPYGRPSPEDEAQPVHKIPYPQKNPKYRHYGNHVMSLINKALDMPEGIKRETLVNTIGNYMKLAYKNWNKEHYVSDDNIKTDLRSISKGEIQLEEEVSLDFLSKAIPKKPLSNQKQGKSGFSNKKNKNRFRRRFN